MLTAMSSPSYRSTNMREVIMPITRSQAMASKVRDEFWHMTAKNADGTPLRARVNGNCTTWKTRPSDFYLPMKHGLRDYFHIDYQKRGTGLVEDPDVWCLRENWEHESKLFAQPKVSTPGDVVMAKAVGVRFVGGVKP